jgi:hypothetical protein
MNAEFSVSFGPFVTFPSEKSGFVPTRTENRAGSDAITQMWALVEVVCPIMGARSNAAAAKPPMESSSVEKAESQRSRLKPSEFMVAHDWLRAVAPSIS